MSATASTRVPAQDRREQILDAATMLFARQGFEGTTTRAIAETARVNEAIIFRHFPTKEELYWAIIQRKCINTGRSKMIDQCIQAGGSDLEIFSAIAGKMLRRTKVDREITRLLLFTALERHELSDHFFQNFVSLQYESLAEYIRRRIADGVFRDIDSTLAARGFMGMVIYHYLVQELFGGSRLRQFDPVETGSALAELWLRGIAIAPATRRTNGNQNRRNGKQAVCVLD